MNRNARLGIVFFCVYAVVYFGFVIANSFWPKAMELPAFGGINWAVSYGFGLIVLAFVLAVIYGVACRADVNQGQGHKS